MTERQSQRRAKTQLVRRFPHSPVRGGGFAKAACSWAESCASGQGLGRRTTALEAEHRNGLLRPVDASGDLFVGHGRWSHLRP